MSYLGSYDIWLRNIGQYRVVLSFPQKFFAVDCHNISQIHRDVRASVIFVCLCCLHLIVHGAATWQILRTFPHHDFFRDSMPRYCVLPSVLNNRIQPNSVACLPHANACYPVSIETKPCFGLSPRIHCMTPVRNIALCKHTVLLLMFRINSDSNFSSLNRTEVGYTQGMAFIAGYLYMHMSEINAFFSMIALMYPKRHNLRYIFCRSHRYRRIGHIHIRSSCVSSLSMR